MIRPDRRAAELAEKIARDNCIHVDAAMVALIAAHDAEVRREAFEAAANAADRLIPGRNYGMGDGDRWTAYVQSRRDAVAAIRSLANSHLEGRPADVPGKP